MKLTKKYFKELVEMLKQLQSSERYLVFIFDAEVGESQFISTGLCYHQVNDLLLDTLKRLEKDVPADEKDHEKQMRMN